MRWIFEELILAENLLQLQLFVSFFNNLNGIISTEFLRETLLHPQHPLHLKLSGHALLRVGF
jgi:hypothetical protein